MNFRQNGDKYLIIIEVIALIVVLVFGAVHFVMPGNKANKKITESQQETQNPTQETDGIQQVQADGQQAAPAFTPSDSVKTKLSSMTTEEKVAQLFITRPEEITGVSQFTQAGNKTKAAIGTYPLGGFVFRQENFSGEAAVIKMMSSLQSFSQERLGVNLFLAIDEEGGIVNRLSWYPQFRAVPFYSPQALYTEGGYPLIVSDTEEKATLLKSVGINMNLAPVCDISTDPNDYIYPRTFGKNPKETATYVKAVVETMNENNIGSTLKHFPGYGNNLNTHSGISIDNRSYESFINNDFIPFKAGIDAGADSILVSHNIITSMDETLPASLSKKVHDIIRNDLGFNGVIMTDDLQMSAIKEYIGEVNSAIFAVNAGNDLIISSDYKVQIPYEVPFLQKASPRSF